MKRVTVFCASNIGTDPDFEQQAYLLGQTLAKNNIGLVYGGANVGLMGAVANGALQTKGEVIGVLPHFLQQKELAHTGLTQLILVDSMHERKTKMNELCDGVIALPGGFGTMEELFEMLTWGQLGLHKKPIGLLNTNGFYNELIAFINTTVSKGVLKPINRDMLIVSNSIDNLLVAMQSYRAPEVGKWITGQTT
jgi:uncharacterized protein (TIGR00730 family)